LTSPQPNQKKRREKKAKKGKSKREKIQINKIRDEKGDITTNANEILRIIRGYFKNWKI
jgi:hypothetical protein